MKNHSRNFLPWFLKIRCYYIQKNSFDANSCKSAILIAKRGQNYSTISNCSFKTNFAVEVEVFSIYRLRNIELHHMSHFDCIWKVINAFYLWFSPKNLDRPLVFDKLSLVTKSDYQKFNSWWKLIKFYTLCTDFINLLFHEQYFLLCSKPNRLLKRRFVHGS